MSAQPNWLPLEGTPQDRQKELLEDFLTELGFLSRRYGLALVDDHETVQLIDVASQSIIGVGLVHDVDLAGRLRGYLAADSILDGVWLVDSADGPVEQHTVMNVFPWRPQ